MRGFFVSLMSGDVDLWILEGDSRKALRLQSPLVAVHALSRNIEVVDPYL